MWPTLALPHALRVFWKADRPHLNFKVFLGVVRFFVTISGVLSSEMLLLRWCGMLLWLLMLRLLMLWLIE